MTMSDNIEVKPVERRPDVDGGWGWIVLIGAFVVYFIADGWSYSIGIIFSEIVEYFDESKGKTALIPTLIYGIPMIISPIVCAFVNVFGCRLVGVIGGCFTSLSFFIAFFATSVNFLCISIGILSSVGLSMVYISSLVVVTQYFNCRRGLATGLAVTGSGLGAFAFPPLMDVLMNLYSWRGMILVTSAVGLNLIPACALYRALRQHTRTRPELGKQELASLARDTRTISSIHPANESNHRCSNVINCLPDTELCRVAANSTHSCGNGEAQSELLSQVRQDIIAANIGDQTVINTTPHDISAVLPTKLTLCQEIKSIPSAVFDRKLFHDATYLVFCSTNFLLFFWVGMPFVYLVDRALELAIDFEQAAFLLSIIAIARTIGQLAMGSIGDMSWVNINLLYAAGVVIIGVATVVVPLCTTYVAMCMYAVVFGMFFSVTCVLPMMCLIEIVGLDQSTKAFGFLQLVQGIGTLLGTPIAGCLFDASGNYDTSFYVAGTWILLSGMALSVMPLIRCLQGRRGFCNRHLRHTSA